MKNSEFPRFCMPEVFLNFSIKCSLQNIEKDGLNGQKIKTSLGLFLTYNNSCKCRQSLVQNPRSMKI